MKFLTLLLIFIVIVSIDKGLTILNIKQVQKNFPESVKDDLYKIERNPVAKFFFQKLGLIPGTLVYGILSVITLFLAFYLLQFLFKQPTNLFIIFLLYGLVIANNIFFLLRYSKMIL